MAPRNLLLISFLFIFSKIDAQNCTNLGQNPGTAFPVCGSSTFVQSTVAICGVRNVPTPCTANGSIFQDKNPYWYSFTCFGNGTLGFLITPNNRGDDYDWELFDVTGHSPNDVYTNASLFVACNWSGETGITGASATGRSFVNCEGTGVPLFSTMPSLQKGHNYLLLVSHFDDTQSGYKLDFTGGTATITDTTAPRLQMAKGLCDGKHIAIKLSKKLKCSTLAANGSDFIISDPMISVTAAEPVNCSNGFDLDSLMLTLSSPLPEGTYKVSIQNGTDANTLLDICDAPIPERDSLVFTVNASEPAAIDSIQQPGCAPDELQLFLNSAIECNSIASDGSDFLLTGPSQATIIGANADCSNGTSPVIKLKLSQPIYSRGTNQVIVQKGSDGNTIINQCALETPVGASATFTTVDTVSAAFTFAVHFGCKHDTTFFSNNGDIGITGWKWQFNNADISTLQNPVYAHKSFGSQQVKLSVTNGVCSDSASTLFSLDNEVKAVFTSPDQLCPNDVATFSDTSIGKIISWNWDFGNGSASSVKSPPTQAYPVSASNKDVLVRLIVQNNHNCFDTAYKQVRILYNCYIAVPSAFTPNGDNKNDYLYPINAWKARNLIFRVYNRIGQLVFESEDFTKKWDGTVHGVKQQTGTFVWTLQYVHADTGKSYFLKGTTVLIR